MIAAHLSECLSIHGSSSPVQIQHLGPLLISWFRLDKACSSFSSDKRSMSSSLGSQPPSCLVTTSSLESLTQDTSPSI